MLIAIMSRGQDCYALYLRQSTVIHHLLPVHSISIAISRKIVASVLTHLVIIGRMYPLCNVSLSSLAFGPAR